MTYYIYLLSLSWHQNLAWLFLAWRKLKLTCTFDFKNSFIQIGEIRAGAKIHAGRDEKQKITE